MESWVHYRAHKSPLLVFFLNYLNRIYNFLVSILSVFSRLGPCLPYRHSNTLYAFIIHIKCPADPLVLDLMTVISVEVYSRITSTKSPSLCKTTFIASLTHITAILHQTHDFLYCLGRHRLPPPPCDIGLGSHTLPAPEAGDFVELILI